MNKNLPCTIALLQSQKALSQINTPNISSPTTVTQAITSLPSSVIKSRADWNVEGNTLYQAIVDGKDKPNGTTRSFVALDGVKYFLKPSNTIITGTGISVDVTNDTGSNADIMAVQMPVPYDTFTVDQMTALVTMYFEGLKGVENPRVKSVGKNLFDKNRVTFGKSVDQTTGVISNNANSIISDYIRVKSGNLRIQGRNLSGYALFDKNKKFIAGGLSQSISVPQNGLIVFNIASTDNLDLVMLNEGTTALPYEPYTETETYLPVTLNRVPNLVADSVDDDGVFVQRIDKDIDVSGTQYASIDLATYTNVDVVKTTAFTTAVAGTTAKDGSTIVLDKNGVMLEEVSQANIDLLTSVGKYYYHTDKSIWFIVADGAYADITAARTGLGTSQAYFQLATPITTQLPISNIIAEPSGTVYIDNMYSDVDFYGTNITVSGKTFNSIEKVLKIDKNTGFETDITSTCTLTAGKDGFTSTALTSGDLVWFALEATGTMIPSFTYSYAMDIKAAVEGNTVAIKQNDSELESLRRLVEQLEQRVQALEP